MVISNSHNDRCFIGSAGTVEVRVAQAGRKWGIPCYGPRERTLTDGTERTGLNLAMQNVYVALALP